MWKNDTKTIESKYPPKGEKYYKKNEKVEKLESIARSTSDRQIKKAEKSGDPFEEINSNFSLAEENKSVEVEQETLDFGRDEVFDETNEDSPFWWKLLLQWSWLAVHVNITI